MGSPDDARLLESAVATNDATDLFHWYKAVSKLSPYWTRQEDMYNKTLGRQTTELQGLTPWRVMSHLLEKEKSPFKEELDVARLALEYISRFEGAEHLLDRETLFQLASAHTRENRSKVGDAGQDLVEFAEKGIRKRSVPALRSKIHRAGRAKSGSSGLGPKEFRVIVDARDWLNVVRECVQDASISCDVDKQWRMALPFLDVAEIEYVRKPEAHNDDPRRTSVWLIHRRLTSFPGALKDPATLFDYAFNRSDGQIFREELGRPQRV